MFFDWKAVPGSSMAGKNLTPIIQQIAAVIAAGLIHELANPPSVCLLMNKTKKAMKKTARGGKLAGNKRPITRPRIVLAIITKRFL